LNVASNTGIAKSAGCSRLRRAAVFSRARDEKHSIDLIAYKQINKRSGRQSGAFLPAGTSPVNTGYKAFFVR
jgi:hypothetical protein